MLELVAERRIAEAVANGELDGLPGAGKPLELDDDALVPEDLRCAYRILKNAGYVPPELEQVNQISRLEGLVLQGETDAAARSRAALKLALLRTRVESRYYGKAIRRLGR